MTTQERVLRAIDRAVQAEGYELDRNPRWANTGTIAAIAPGELGSDRTVWYDFQGGGASFCKSNRFADHINRDTAMVPYNVEALRACVDTVVAFLIGEPV